MRNRQRGILGLGMIKLVFLGVGLLGIAGTVFAAYKYVDNIRQENVILHANAAKMETAIELKTAEVEQARAGMKALAEELARVNSAFTSIREDRDKRKGVFDDHDFTALLNAKPELVERRMLIATDGLWRDFEQASRD